MAGRASFQGQQSEPADVLIVTALRMERDAVKAVSTGALGEWTEARVPSTELRIERRSFRAVDGSVLRLALICAEEMGGTQTMGVVGPTLMAVRPRCLAMCGVLAGKPNDTEFGDVLIADQLLLHDAGKRTEKGFEHATRSHKLDIRWLEKVRDFAENPGDALSWLERTPWTPAQERAWLLDQFSRGFKPAVHKALVAECCPSYRTLIAALLAEGLVQAVEDEPLTEKGKTCVASERLSDLLWPALDPPRRSITVHVAPIASGNAVQADPALWRELSVFARKTLGVEMESYAIGTAAELHQIELALVMKGVMDHADEHKDDRFKSFAARASAECLIGFVRAHLKAGDSESDEILWSGTSTLPSKVGPAALLNARHEIVDFVGRGALLGEFAEWCEQEVRMGARLMWGAGGMGKTRLMIQFCKEMRGKGWRAGFVPKGMGVDRFAEITYSERPVLAVIDYAESRMLLRDMLEAVAVRRSEKSKRRLRLVLLARNNGDWWADLLSSDGLVTDLLCETDPIALQPLAAAAAQREAVFYDAVEKLAKARNKAVPGGAMPNLDDSRYDRVLFLHMAALAVVEGRELRVATLMEDTLDHEERFWREQLRGKGRTGERLAIDKMRRAVSSLTLTGGATSAARADSLIARVESKGDIELVRLLRDIYPGIPGSTAISGLEPDLLGGAMVFRTMSKEASGAGAYLDRVFDGEEEPTFRTGFEVLGRLSDQHAEAQKWLALMLARDVPGRAHAAFAAAMSVGEHTAHAGLGLELAKALEREGTVEIAERLEAELPDDTVSLREVALWVTEMQLTRVLDVTELDAQSERARLLSYRGCCQSDLGQREAALESTQEAVSIYRRIAKDHPAKYLADLAMSLNNLSNFQTELGQREAAFVTALEAVAIYRRLAEEHPDEHLPDLAMSLNNLSMTARDLGHREMAHSYTVESVGIRRGLAKTYPDRFQPSLARSLSNLGIAESDLGHRELALASTLEATGIYRRLAEENPDEHLPDLAQCLNNLGNRQREVGQWDAALAATLEGLDIDRRLAKARPAAFLPGLAQSVNNLSERQRDLGLHEAALASALEAVELRRSLMEARPAAFLPDLAESLDTLGKSQGDMGLREAALASASEAVEIRSRLAGAHPDVFSPHLAESLDNLGERQRALGQCEAALASALEAVEIRSRLAGARPHVFLPHLAESLNNLARIQSELGQIEGAFASSQQALDTIWPFFLALPRAFARNVALSISSILARLRSLGRPPSTELLERCAALDVHLAG